MVYNTHKTHGQPPTKKHTQWPQTCTHVTLTTTQLNASQESSALQTEKLEVAASKGAAQAAGTPC